MRVFFFFGLEDRSVTLFSDGWPSMLCEVSAAIMLSLIISLCSLILLLRSFCMHHVYVCTCLFISLSILLMYSICLNVPLSIYLSISMYGGLTMYVCLCIHLFIYLSISLSCVSVSISLWTLTLPYYIFFFISSLSDYISLFQPFF